MAVQLLLVALVPLAAAAYPLDPGRYGRSSLGAWPPLSAYYYPPRTTRPYYYLPQDPYYYPVVPSYYQRPFYYGYDEVAEPVDDQEDMLEEEEGVDRGEATGPGAYGQETYLTGVDPSMTYQETDDDVNARFLQNLILAQMYSDANKLYGYEDAAGGRLSGGGGGGGGGDRWVYGEPVKSGQGKAAMAKEDEDVRELKSLVRGSAGDKKKERRERGGNGGERRERSGEKSRKNKENPNPFSEQLKSNDWDEFRSSSYKRVDAKTSSTSAPARGGQKEEVMTRPAFQLHVNQRSGAGARQPSVFDTIKKLLHMEEQLEEKSTSGASGSGSGSGSRLQKRSYIPSEDSLVAELGGLKKMA